MTFREWLDKTYYEGFDPSDLSDEEYSDLEDMYYVEVDERQIEQELQQRARKHFQGVCWC